ncbi:ABC transporter permease [Bifidobacterium pseudolongum]|uniref:ABC transporter permease n=1 Tax=Bifidobacterium pseudolongum TaxID=1694 RepID=UPI000501F0CD|nr:ABC transporter permease [Bifidobacterium pseudolongum]KFI79985.1 multidrug ABC transporter permease [Bifidobacterium pseudolongum subsp. pseudolongum]UNP90907.1 ABC transporter permease [Bifidobacterium pseudolongum subsp. pseudolongum]WCA41384.1 ABC transporter permease [Bifidobacterium pseudolongum subsp. pseudolongum]
MWSTFLTTLRINLREKSSLFWLFCFPILLSTMFLGMFGNLGATYEITTMRFAVVANDDYCKAEGAQQLIAAMQRTPVAPQACGTAPATMDVDAGDTDLRDLLDVTAVDTVGDASDLINDDHDVRGFLTVDGDGMVHMTISRATVSNANDAMGSPGLPISLSILNGAIGMFNRQMLTVAQIMGADPAVLHDADFTAAVQETPDFTHQVRLTNFKPDESARYYYALLAMTALMAMSFAVTTVCATQANLSALGMRRSMAPLTRLRQLMGGFLASWLCTFCSLLVALLYIHFVCRISFGGRWAATMLAIVVASFASNALGTLLGSLPKLTAGTKIGLTTAISCVLSLLSGLYGSGAMALSDWIQRNAPIVAMINPTQQVTNLFYDILYYDSYTPFFRTVGILLTMAVLALALATVFLRRQRYAHL